MQARSAAGGRRSGSNAGIGGALVVNAKTDIRASGAAGVRSGWARAARAARAPRAWTRLAAGALVAAMAAGCGGGGAGAELSTRPEPLALRESGPKTLTLPGDGGYSIRHQEASRVADLDGEADSAAAASREGTATASASVRGGGRAAGLFQLGHAFRNESERQTDLKIAVQLEFEYAASNEPPTALPDAAVGLTLYARDGRNRLLRTIPVLSHTTEQGGVSSRGQENLELTVTLGPGESVNVYLVGSARVELKPGRSAQSEVKLLRLGMEVASQPAPAVRAGGG